MSRQLLLFQFGPVQEFIAQARTTRDLWSGSYLISWMSAQFVARLRKDLCGDVEFVFPFIDSQEIPPALRWIEEDCSPGLAEHALLPTIPNRILAVVPGTWNALGMRNSIDAVFRYGSKSSAWRRISDSCFEFLDKAVAFSGEARELWPKQLEGFWQSTWQLGPLSSEEEQLAAFKKTPIGAQAAQNSSSSFGDWMPSYHLAAYRLDARRQTRVFDAWHGAPSREKDTLSGKEEAVIDRTWLGALACRFREDDAPEEVAKVCHLFRSQDLLAAPNAIKRVWHRAYLEKEQGFSKGVGSSAGDSYFNIPSVPGIAAAAWTEKAFEVPNGVFRSKLKGFVESTQRIGQYADLVFAKRRRREQPEDWMRRIDWQVFQESFWTTEIAEAVAAKNDRHRAVAEEGLTKLQSLFDETAVSRPERYFAVLSMDGDGIGQWLSGSKLKKPLDREFHGRLSSLLANASLGEAAYFDDPMAESPEVKKIAESHGKFFHGKVIYAGADDFLVLLPASEAIQCAIALRNHFAGTMSELSASPQFTISAGITIGHIKEPLQDMVQISRDELKRAKRDLSGDALALSLFKRSGETIEWSARFDSEILKLLEFFQGPETGQPRYRKLLNRPDYTPPISGRFPYALTEALAPLQNFAVDGPGKCPDFSKPLPLRADLNDGVLKLFQHVVFQQTDLTEPERKAFESLARATLAQICDRRPLQDFYNLFNIEAFLARRDR